MAVDLRIRPLGRPKISKDSALGFQRIARRYVVEGRKVTKNGLDGSWDGEALFRPVGEEDEEFEKHFLVNQKIEPGKTVDKAYLTREYVELRKTWYAEQSSETPHLKTLSRKYVVLRYVNVSLGYAVSIWARHPTNTAGTSDSNDPWDFLPEIIKNTQPTVGYTIADVAASAAAVPTSITNPLIGGVALATQLTGALTDADLSWLPANASVDTSNPGIDVWSVSWKLPGTPSWSLASGQGGAFKTPRFIDFDENGFHVRGSPGNASGTKTVYAFTLFYTGENPPALFLNAAGGSAGDPVVSMDFYFDGMDGRMLTMKSTYSNAIIVYGVNANDPVRFKDANGTDVDIGTKNGAKNEIVFNFESGHGYNQSPTIDALPRYQNRPFIKAGGNITWTSGWNTAVGGTQLIGAKVKALHSHKEKRIWAIQLSYV